jgi:hypothetical protein
MKTDPEFESQEQPLIDATLQDESWQMASAGFKAEALKTFHARQRVRRLTRWAGAAAVLAVVVTGIAIHRPAKPERVATRTVHQAVRASASTNAPEQLTDEQLLASFPKGSCFLAEVGGRKELVFYSEDAQHNYVVYPAGSAARGN